MENNIYCLDNNIEEYSNKILELNIQIDLIKEKVANLDSVINSKII